jgi:hypothetical protein
MKIFFHHSPEVFDGVQFAMKFWQEKAQVPHSFNGLLNKRFLPHEVRLKFEDPFVAACIRLTPLLAPPLQICSMFGEDGFDTFWLVQIYAVIITAGISSAE